MRKTGYLLFFITLLSLKAFAQNWHLITTISGLQSNIDFTGIDARVTQLGFGHLSSGGTSPCDASITYHYHVGNNQSNGYGYKFLPNKVNRVRLRMGNIGPNEALKITVNGNPYIVKDADIVAYGTCVDVADADDITGEVKGRSTVTDVYGQIVIDMGAIGIDSLTVEHLTGFTGGAGYDIAFGLDTPLVFKYPFKDSMLCAGDEFNLDYIVNNSSFNPGNTFTAELSDALGVFSSPKVIGSVTSNVSGVIPCKIPANQSSGTNYRIRIKSSSPAGRESVIAIPIRIDRFPLMPSAILHKDSFCEGDSLHLETKYPAPGMSVLWTGPVGWSDDSTHALRLGLQLEDSGNYYFIASLGACRAYDTVSIKVFMNPIIQSITNNSPMCEEDTLRIILEADTMGLPVTYEWTHSNTVFWDTVKNPVINGVTDAFNGQFNVKATLGFCSVISSTDPVEIYTKPDKPEMSNNGPIYPGTELRLRAITPTPDVKYLWSGPDNFYDTIAEPKIQFTPVAAAGVYTVTITLGTCSTIGVTVVQVYDPGQKLDLYPNPAVNGIIKLTGIARNDQMMPYILLDMSGSKVYEGKIPTSRRLVNETITLPNSLPNGLYYLKLRVDNSHQIYPVTIMR